jgi:hypothetical protein
MPQFTPDQPPHPQNRLRVPHLHDQTAERPAETLLGSRGHQKKSFVRNLEKVGAKNLELVFLADLFLRGKHALGPFYEEELSMPLDSLGECFSEVTLYLSCVDSTYVWSEDKPCFGSLDDAIKAARNCVLRMVGSEMDVVEEAAILDATDDERLLIVSFKRDFEE